MSMELDEGYAQQEVKAKRTATAFLVTGSMAVAFAVLALVTAALHEWLSMAITIAASGGTAWVANGAWLDRCEAKDIMESLRHCADHENEPIR